jgi:hypothetical protein
MDVSAQKPLVILTYKVNVPKLVKGDEKAQREMIFQLEHQSGDTGDQIHVIGRLVAAINDQAADVQGRSLAIVPTYRAIAFLDPPADGALIGIVYAVQEAGHFDLSRYGKK